MSDNFLRHRHPRPAIVALHSWPALSASETIGALRRDLQRLSRVDWLLLCGARALPERDLVSADARPRHRACPCDRRFAAPFARMSGGRRAMGADRCRGARRRFTAALHRPRGRRADARSFDMAALSTGRRARGSSRAACRTETSRRRPPPEFPGGRARRFATPEIGRPMLHPSSGERIVGRTKLDGVSV